MNGLFSLVPRKRLIQRIFTCSNSIIKILHKDLLAIKAPEWSHWNRKHQNDVIDVVLLSLLLTLYIFCTFSVISFVHFQHLFVFWVCHYESWIRSKGLSSVIIKGSASSSKNITIFFTFILKSSKFSKAVDAPVKP